MISCGYAMQGRDWSCKSREHVWNEVLGSFYMLDSEVIFENQSLSLSNIFFGTVFPLKFMMLGNAEQSIRIRK